MTSRENHKKGVATIEVLIAFAIIVLSMGGVVMVTFGNQISLVDAQIKNEAIYKSIKMMEDLRSASREDFNLVNPSSWPENSGLVSFTKKTEVKQLDFFTKIATTTVSWEERGKKMSVFQTTLLTNINGIDAGETCSSIISGDWKSPTVTSYELGKDLIGDNSSGYPITAIDIYKSKLFLSVNNSNGNNSPTFFIFNIANPLNPILVSSVDNDPTVKLGLNAISATDSYSYVANAKQSNFGTCAIGTCGQLQIINVSTNPPTVIKTFKIPGVTGTAGQSVGQSILYRKDGLTGKEYVYLGLAKTQTGPEFNIIDVTDKNNPVYKGGFSVGNAVNSIFIKNNLAYIATPNTENLTILDISNPGNQIRMSGYSPAGGSNGKSVYTVGSTIFLGRTFGTNEFHILNASNPSSISVTATKDIGTGNTTSINGVLVRDYLAFMITNTEFQVWNISNVNNITPWTPNNITSEFVDLPGGRGSSMDCEGNYLFVGSVPVNDKGFISIISAN